MNIIEISYVTYQESVVSSADGLGAVEEDWKTFSPFPVLLWKMPPPKLAR